MTNVVPHYIEVGDLMSPNSKREHAGKKWLVVGLTTHANKLIFLCIDANNNYETFEVEKMKFHSHYVPEASATTEKAKGTKKEVKNGNTNSDTVGASSSGVSTEELQTTNQ